MHIAPYDNQNKPIVDVEDSTVPLNYFNIVKLEAGQAFDYQTPGYETCIVPATGTADVEVEGFTATDLGGRGEHVLDGDPEGDTLSSGAKNSRMATDTTEVTVVYTKLDETNKPFTLPAG